MPSVISRLQEYVSSVAYLVLHNSTAQNIFDKLNIQSIHYTVLQKSSRFWFSLQLSQMLTNFNDIC